LSLNKLTDYRVHVAWFCRTPHTPVLSSQDV